MSQTIQPVDPSRMFSVSLTLAQWNTHLALLSLIPALLEGQTRQVQTQLMAQLDPQSAGPQPPPDFAAQTQSSTHPVANGQDS